MLHLEIQNAKNREDLCESIVEWFYLNFLSKYKLEIIIEHKNLEEDGVYGYCDISPYETKLHRPRSFLIEMHHKLDVDNYISSIIHELIHISQFCKGDLKIKSSKRHWKGTLIEGLEYDEQPHEIEAHTLEPILYEEFLTYLDCA